MNDIELRDYFAAHAPEPPRDFRPLQVERATASGNGFKISYHDESETARMVRWRYVYADAMLKARHQS